MPGRPGHPSSWQVFVFLESEKIIHFLSFAGYHFNETNRTIHESQDGGGGGGGVTGYCPALDLSAF